MFKKLTALVMCLVFLTITSEFIFAEDVYITNQGKKYHQEDCRFIKNRETQKIDIEEAKTKGLEPCGRCFGAAEEITEKQINTDEDTVYVTKNGKKYHKPECNLIKNRDTTGMSITDAQVKDLTACSKCFRDKQAKAE